ncbi:glycoside hydrolase family 23 protein, partial [Serendipita vermifera]
WLTCGIRNGGWNPPKIDMNNIIYKSLRDILNSGGGPFNACRDYVDHFEDAARDTNLPSSLLASIAMQESSCNPNATGRAGEIGMMQVTGEKCPSNGNCYDARTNIYIGANYLRGRIDANGGNIVQAMGEYNGWFVGMNEWDASNHPCGQRNNLDYLNNVFNGYLQGVDPSSINMGVFFNVC